MVGKSRRLVQLIGGFKLLKAFVLLASLAFVFHLLEHDHSHSVIHWALKLHVDPKNKYLRAALAKVLNLDAAHLRLLGVGTILYATLFAAEGIGLLCDSAWAEYLTILETAGFIPLEIYEIVHRVSAMRIVVLVGNLAIVVYLVGYMRQRARARGLMRHSHRVALPGDR
jgi:uncharacterized membrane protein (DUF2068 family)